MSINMLRVSKKPSSALMMVLLLLMMMMMKQTQILYIGSTVMTLQS